MDSLPVKGFIFDIKKFSIHDGPGIRTTVFMKGCPLRCPWCHNPESQRTGPDIMLHGERCIGCLACLEVCAYGAISLNGGGVVTDRLLCVQCGTCTETCFADARNVVGREVSVAELMAEIEQDNSFFDESGGGVTFSGGDPLLQHDFLLAVLKACREKEIHTAVDTSGAFSWQSVAEIMPYVDLFLYDLKVMDPRRHKDLTGVANRRILDNLRKLSALGQKIMIRVAVIPGVNDDEENMRLIAEFVSSLPQVEGLSLLPYHGSAAHKYTGLGRSYEMADAVPPTAERMGDLARLFERTIANVQIGG